MSKHKSNVHPDHYKTAGREPQGRDVVQSLNRQAYALTRSRQKDQFFRAMEQQPVLESGDTGESGKENAPVASPAPASKGRSGAGPVLVKPAARGSARPHRATSTATRATPAASRRSSHSPRFAIADQEAVETLISKLRRRGGTQLDAGKLRKAFETAAREFKSTRAAERQAFFHGLMTGYGVGVKTGHGRARLRATA